MDTAGMGHRRWLPSETWFGQMPVLVIFGGMLALGVFLWLGNQGRWAAVAPGKVAANGWLVLSSLPSLGAIWLAAAGWGYPVRRWVLGEGSDRWLVQTAVGLAGLMVAQYLVAIVGLLGAISTLVLVAVGLAWLCWQITSWAIRNKALATSSSVPEGLWLPWPTVLMMPGLGLMLVAAASPPGTRWRLEAYGYDVISYHLQLPREWLARGQVMGLEHNVYSFLPDLMETAYAGIAAVHGSMLDSIYTCQFFHVSLALFTAVILAAIINRFGGPLAGAAGGAVFMSLPWTVITGSLAYTEMGMLGFAAAGLLVMCDRPSDRTAVAAVVGFLLGASTLCKLTAGPMLAAPLGLVMLLGPIPALRGRKPPSWKNTWHAFAVTALAGLITLSPYLLRNAVESGNPVFPFATGVLGNAHWNETLVNRWQAAHGLSESSSHLGLDAWSDLARQWPYNTGYGAIGGQAVHAQVTDIARFGYEWGFPLLGVAVLLGAALAIRPGITRRLTAALGLVMVFQVGFWLLGTHHPSRYLIPTLIPACVLIGLGMGRLSERSRWARLCGPIAALVLPLVLATVSLGVLLRQSRPLTIQGKPAPWAWVDSLDRPMDQGLIARHPINELPRDSRTLVVADNGALLYLRRPFDYASVFDPGQLGQVIRSIQAGSAPLDAEDAEQVTARLRRRGYTHVWIGWSELNRIQVSFGLLDPITPALLRRLSEDWPVVVERDGATLFRLPREAMNANR